jgi:hypothetical protein
MEMLHVLHELRHVSARNIAFLPPVRPAGSSGGKSAKLP